MADLETVSSSQRLKVLLCCYACDPTRGSEPGMGWNFVYNISLHHDVHVIVEGKYRENLEQYSQEHPEQVKHVTFYFVDRLRLKRLRKIWPPSYYWTYHRWHRDVLKLARELQAKEKFDLSHMITLSGYREPSLLWKLDAPFIWGPIGGLTDTPWCLMPCLGVYGALFFAVRNVLNGLEKRFGRRAAAAAAHSHTILTSTHDGMEAIRKNWHREAVLMNEVGLETRHAPHTPVAHEPGTPLRVCWAGVHEPRKALDILLRALTKCKQPIEVHVLSKGPRTEAWKKLARKLGVADKVIFHGFLPREEAFSVMANSHAFAITSVREDTSTVVFEAFRYGLPIVVMDHCGFAAVVNDSCGIKIPIQTLQQVIDAYAENLDYLATHEEERQEKSRGAVARCNDFTWEGKMECLDRIYADAVAGVSVDK